MLSPSSRVPTVFWGALRNPFFLPLQTSTRQAKSYLTVPAEPHCLAQATLHEDKVSVWVNYKVK